MQRVELRSLACASKKLHIIVQAMAGDKLEKCSNTNIHKLSLLHIDDDYVPNVWA